MIKCYICGSNSNKKREGSVRDNPNLGILECEDCGLVFLSRIDHITDSHYSNSGMHGETVLSIAEWLKDSEEDDARRYKFLRTKLINKNLLDFGCGAGGFLLKSSKDTTSSDGVELELRLQNHFIENSLKVWTNLKDLHSSQKKYDIITAFHVVEHLIDPRDTILQLASLLADNGELIIEVPSSNDALLTLYKSESFSKFTYWSQHLYLFNNETLARLIKQAGLELNWIKQIQRYSLSNHLYWLAQNKPGGHKTWAFLDSEELRQAYESQLAALGLCDTIIVSIKKKS